MRFSSRSRLSLAGLLALLALASTAAAGGAATGASPASGPQRIIAGDIADPGAWPSIGALYIRPRGTGRKFLDCGATVIAPSAALTAAHCVFGERAKRFSLVVGRPNLADKSIGQDIPIRATKVNPAYGPPNYRADVAVLLLQRDAGVPAAALPSVAQSDAATVLGAPLRVGGWGGTKPDGSRASKPLLTTGEVVIDGSSCKRSYGAQFATKTTICTQGEKLAAPRRGHAGACYGDSGGPLMADTAAGPLLVGTVSGGGGRCGTSADYYARVSANLEFIRSAAGVAPGVPSVP